MLKYYCTYHEQSNETYIYASRDGTTNDGLLSYYRKGDTVYSCSGHSGFDDPIAYIIKGNSVYTWLDGKPDGYLCYYKKGDNVYSCFGHAGFDDPIAYIIKGNHIYDTFDSENYSGFDVNSNCSIRPHTNNSPSFFERLEFDFDLEKIAKVVYFFFLAASFLLSLSAFIALSIMEGWHVIFDILPENRILYWILTGTGGAIAFVLLVTAIVLTVNETIQSGQILFPLASLIMNISVAFAGSLAITFLVPAIIAFVILSFLITRFADNIGYAFEWCRSNAAKLIYRTMMFLSFAIALSCFIYFWTMEGSDLFYTPLWLLPPASFERLPIYYALMGSGALVSLCLIGYDVFCRFSNREEFPIVSSILLLLLNVSIVLSGVCFWFLLFAALIQIFWAFATKNSP